MGSSGALALPSRELATRFQALAAENLSLSRWSCALVCLASRTVRPYGAPCNHEASFRLRSDRKLAVQRIAETCAN